MTLGDEGLDAGAGKAGQGVGEQLVDPQAICLMPHKNTHDTCARTLLTGMDIVKGEDIHATGGAAGESVRRAAGGG